ncbi:MAG: transglycosylase [bacterium]|nr:transglycosylase [bacterium]
MNPGTLRAPLRGAVVVSLLLVLACPQPPRQEPATEPAAEELPAQEVTRPQEALRPSSFATLPPLLDDGDWESLRQAIVHSRRWLAGRAQEERFVFGPRELTARQMLDGCDRLLGWLEADPSPEGLAARVVHGFDVLESVGGSAGEMLITGYYEPVIAGNLRRTAEYQVPVYGLPKDIIKVSLGDFSEQYRGVHLVGRLSGNRLVPYPSRREIRERAALRGKQIAWTRDRVDLFFIEVQGSGALRLPNGREMRIGYAGSNGRPYRSIGRLLIDQGKIEREKISMQSIRDYLARHPEEVTAVLDYNESVVFFRKLSGPPVGSLGVPVTPRRTIATDHRLFPQGALGFLVSEIPAMGPDGRTVGAGPLTRFVLNQDSGGAIRGTDRADFFWGRGEEAATRAGLMKQPGRLFFLAPKQAR